MKVALVGKYALGTLEKIKNKLPEDIEILAVESREKFNNLKDAECVILRGLSIDQEDIHRILNLKLIQRWGVGYNNVDIKTAGEKGIYVCNLPGINAYAVAEMVILYILALFKNLIQHHSSLLKGRWTRDSFNERTYTLKNKIVGLIGFGNVARQVNKMIQCFGATVQYYDIIRLNFAEEEKQKVTYVSLEHLLKTSDVVSLHLPLTKETQNLISKENLKLMKETAIIINTSRGGIINEKDLYDVLVANKILGAGLDCFAIEPIESGNPLLKLENVILTPHIGGASADLADEMIPPVVENLLRIRNNQKPKNIVNNEYIKI
ncbi:MAG: hypothetical protein Kow00103_02580 [Candidatus Caldatribacteriota bacterium]